MSKTRILMLALSVVLITVIAGALLSTCRSHTISTRLVIPDVDQSAAREAVLEAQAAGEQVKQMEVFLLGTKSDLESIPQQVQTMSPEEKVKEGERLFQ